MGRKKLSLVLLLLLVSSATLVGFSRRDHDGDPLPPLGKRQYLLPTKRSYQPVIISKIHEPLAPHSMRDPVQPGSLEPPVPHIRPKPAPAPKPIAKAGQLHFRKMPVSGRLTQPRVDFTQENLPVTRADEPVGEDFYPRVFTPAQDDSF